MSPSHTASYDVPVSPFLQPTAVVYHRAHSESSYCILSTSEDCGFVKRVLLFYFLQQSVVYQIIVFPIDKTKLSNEYSPDDLIASHRQLKLNFGPEVYNYVDLKFDYQTNQLERHTSISARAEANEIH